MGDPQQSVSRYLALSYGYVACRECRSISFAGACVGCPGCHTPDAVKMYFSVCATFLTEDEQVFKRAGQVQGWHCAQVSAATTSELFYLCCFHLYHRVENAVLQSGGGGVHGRGRGA
eukprot:639915-Rhodomonas_salina.1